MFLDIKSVGNIRDLGGIKTKDGKIIKSKCLLRSGDLHNLSKSDKKILYEDYNLKLIIDFRSSKSFLTKKDILEKDTIYKHIHVLDELETTSYSRKIKHPKEFFIHVYESLAVCPEAAIAYQNFFRWIINNKEGAILYHCTSGKDRTGIATSLLLHILGCDKETIYKEYLLSNEYTMPLYVEALSKVENITKYDQEYYETFYICKKEFIDAYFEAIDKNFGSLDQYLYKYIKISDDDIITLKEKFLREP